MLSHSQTKKRRKLKRHTTKLMVVSLDGGLKVLFIFFLSLSWVFYIVQSNKLLYFSNQKQCFCC